jgi:lipopolysaccharide export system permease protein
MSFLRVRKLDRYYALSFLKMMVLAIVGVIFVFILVNFFERLDHFMSRKPSILAILEFYLYQIPYLFVLLLPVAGLLASFFSVGESARKNEILILRASGISIYRLFLPFLLIGLLNSFIAFKVNESLAPNWLRKARIVKLTKIEHRKVPYTRNFARNLSFWSRKKRLFFFGTLDAKVNEARRVTVIEFEKGRVKRRIDAQSAKFKGKFWTFYSVTIRTFEREREVVEKVDSLEERDFTIEPREFLKGRRELEEMTLKQLRQRIEILKETGMSTLEEEVEIQTRYSFPLANLIILLFAIPLAISQRGHGRTYGFGLAV